VALGDQFDVELSTLGAALCGQPVSIVDAETDRRGRKVMDKGMRLVITGLDEWKRLPESLRRGVDPRDWLRVERTLRESDVRMCRSIGVDRGLGALLMTRAWGKPFTEERDHRTPPRANAQRKGQISRRLKAELVKEGNRGNH
jgi:hypothetical protein